MTADDRTRDHVSALVRQLAPELLAVPGLAVVDHDLGTITTRRLKLDCRRILGITINGLHRSSLPASATACRVIPDELSNHAAELLPAVQIRPCVIGAGNLKAPIAGNSRT